MLLIISLSVSACVLTYEYKPAGRPAGRPFHVLVSFVMLQLRITRFMLIFEPCVVAQPAATLYHTPPHTSPLTHSLTHPLYLDAVRPSSPPAALSLPQPPLHPTVFFCRHKSSLSSSNCYMTAVWVGRGGEGGE